MLSRLNKIPPSTPVGKTSQPRYDGLLILLILLILDVCLNLEEEPVLALIRKTRVMMQPKRTECRVGFISVGRAKLICIIIKLCLVYDMSLIVQTWVDPVV